MQWTRVQSEVFISNGGEVLMPNNEVRGKKDWVPILANLDIVKAYNWCKCIVDKLNYGIQRSNETKQPSSSGCILVLAVSLLINSLSYMLLAVKSIAMRSIHQIVEWN